ncbi:MAG: long-chain-acyl-CoA synthetase [Deltaproteobacteria bacterium]|nr:long-chain-acyl-CoA synthetase [Deltaproteobacteria bacterium]
MEKTDSILGQEMIKFRDLIPGILSLLKRFPSVVKNIKAALAMEDEDQKSIGWVLEENARLYPDKTAILFEDDRLTHKEFNEAINRHTHYFLSLGLKKGDSVIVLIENRPELLIVVSALAKIGVISSLINTNQRDKVLVHSINLTKGRVFVIGEELVEAFEEVRSDLELTGDETMYFVADKRQASMPKGYIDLPDAVKEFPTENPLTTKEVLIKDPICYIFTSGTTGLPKAAYLGNRRWVGSQYGFGKLIMNLTPDDVLYCTLPLFHTTAFCVGWPTAAANGSAMAIRRKFSVSNFWKDVEKFNATAFVYIGELCRYLLNQPTSPNDKKNPMKKMVGNGLRPDIWNEFKTRFGIEQIAELYGATEFGFAFTNFFNIDNTIGMCLTPFEIVKYDIDLEQPILDENGFMQKIEKGGTGLLLAEISDKTPFHGYTNKEATESKIRRDVFEKGDIWLDTGDLIRDQGYKHIQFADRLGDTFRWKGENVSTTEVEEIISSIPEVSQTAAFGVSIPGTDGKAGMAAIIPFDSAADFDLKALAVALVRSLPSYAVPKFIRLKKEFENTPTFKVKKSVLRTEGFDPGQIKDPLYAMLPGESEYFPLTPELYKEIESGKYRF